jgi:glycosyltransferase involved in cell wall biosynthesis
LKGCVIAATGGFYVQLAVPNGNGNSNTQAQARASRTVPATDVLDRSGDLLESSVVILDRPGDLLKSSTVSVVIPTMNEAENIVWVLKQMPTLVDEVVLVDAQSTDGTVEAALRVRPDIVVVEQEPRGKGTALQAGFSAATGDIIVMLDGDGSMNPGEIHRYVALVSSGFDLVKGSRFMAGAASTDITWLRRLGNGGLRFLTNVLHGTRFTDLCYGYCAFRRDSLEQLSLTATGFEIETELVVHACMARLRITEVASLESPRRNGKSNLRTFRDGKRVLWTLLKESVRPSMPARPAGRPE